MTTVTTKTKPSTYLSFLLDRSGSMQSVRDATITGFNEYLQNQVDVDGDLDVTVTLFDYDADKVQIDTIVDRIPGDQVLPLNQHSYQPRGMTPLYDAVGHTLTKAIEHTNTHHYDTKVFVIMTDGYENSSSEWAVEKVRELIKTIEDDGWQVVFLGANQDAWASAQNIGSMSGTYVTYGMTADSVQAATRTASQVSSSYRAGGQSLSGNFDVTNAPADYIPPNTDDVEDI